MWLRNYFLTLLVESKAIARVGGGRMEERWQRCLRQTFQNLKIQVFLSREISVDSSARMLNSGLPRAN